MAKERKVEKMDEQTQMSPEEAKAFRASLYVPQAVKLSDQQKREQFRVFWAQNRKQYGKSKDIESILWLHMVSTKNDDPENFLKGIENFGLKAVNK